MIKFLLELRKRLIYCIVFFASLFVFCFYFNDQIFQFLLKPILQALPYQRGIIATQITAPVFLPLNLAADTALLMTIPFLLIQLWQFISPALYLKEKQKIKFAIALSLSLFSLGLLFCFYIVLPYMFQFFISALPTNVQMMPDIQNILHFILRMLVLFGICFQVPLACLFFCQMQWINLNQLKAIRPYVIVAAFIVGMLLTPPDVLSQILLAVPLCMLYELGILLCQWRGNLGLHKN